MVGRVECFPLVGGAGALGLAFRLVNHTSARRVERVQAREGSDRVMGTFLFRLECVYCLSGLENFNNGVLVFSFSANTGIMRWCGE